MPTLLFRLAPLPWLALTVAAAGVGMLMFARVVAPLGCQVAVPADGFLPLWIYTALFVALCAAQASIWLPIAACAPLLRVPTRKTAEVLLYVVLFAALTALQALGLGLEFADNYGDV